MFQKFLMLFLGLAIACVISGCGGGDEIEEPQTFQDAPTEPPKRGIVQ